MSAVFGALLAVAVSMVACTSTSPRRPSPTSASTRRSRPRHQARAFQPATRLRGTPGWRITRLGAQHAIEGFADRASVLPGQPVRLFISTTAQRYTVTAYRMGPYRGSQARKVWTSAPQPGVRQPGAVVRKPTNTVVAPWRPSLKVATRGWRPGDYLFRLDASNGDSRFVPLTVRTPSNAGRIVVVNAVTTWQAYNRWGGYSLYTSPGGSHARRSRAVSFDRPYQETDMHGAGDFLYFELPFVTFAQRLGIRLGYATDVDLHADPHLLDGARAVVTLGHDEYWSAAMRNAVVRARGRGVNLAFFGGNAIYRHMRMAPTRLGPNRLEIDYKSFSQDPYHTTDPRNATPQWRSPPYPRPESTILGNYYRCNPVQGNMVAADPHNWLLHGIVTKGETFPDMIGNEYEQVDLAVPTPRPIEVLFHSPVTCQGRRGFSDASYYTTPSGAAVFSAGTQYWICGLAAHCPRSSKDGGRARRAITAITTRLLLAYARGPGGRAHPAHDNLAALGVPGAKPSPPARLPHALVKSG